MSMEIADKYVCRESFTSPVFNECAYKRQKRFIVGEGSVWDVLDAGEGANGLMIKLFREITNGKGIKLTVSERQIKRFFSEIKE